MFPCGRAGRWIVGALVVAAVPARAAAQTTAAPPRGVQASVTATTVYDDNVLGQPVAAADEILRLTPSFSVTGGKPRLNLTGSVTFDAERFQSHRDLTTMQARQVETFSGSFRAAPHTTLSFNAGRSSTTNPAELNTLTALNIGRQRASRWQGGSSLHRVLGPTSTLDFGYDLSRDRLSGGTATTTHAVDVRLAKQPSQHSDIYVRVNGRRFEFGAAGTAPVLSTFTNAGWSAHGKSAHVTAEAGVQRTNGAMGSTVDFSAGRKFGQTDLTAGYGRGVTTALGVTGTIAFDHVQVSAVYQGRPTMATAGGTGTGGLRMAARFGASRNQISTATSTSLQWAAELTKPLARMLAVQVSYDGSTQQMLAGALGPALGDIRRNRVTFTLAFLPWSPR